jgi:dTDP-glucose 4,6-dehydratase
LKTLLIIGGSGFFGKSILDCFQRGLLEPWEIDHVIVMSRNASRMKYEVPRLVSSDVELISADICEIETLPIAEVVINAAASTDASKYINNPQIERSNIEL